MPENEDIQEIGRSSSSFDRIPLLQKSDLLPSSPHKISKEEQYFNENRMIPRSQSILSALLANQSKIITRVPPQTDPVLTVFPSPERPIEPIRIETSPGQVNETIKSASNNTMIILSEGDYFETLIIDKPIHFLAKGKVRFVSEGDKDILIVNEFSSFEGISFIQQKSQSSVAVIVNKNSVLFENCSFYSNFTSGVFVKNNSATYFKNCLFQSGGSAALLASQNAQISITKCSFKNIQSNGILLKETSKSLILESFFSEILNSGIMVQDSSQLLVENCQFDTIQKSGIECSTSSDQVLIKSSRFSNCKLCGIFFYQPISAVVTGCSFSEISGHSIETRDGVGLTSRANKFGQSNSINFLISDNSSLLSIDDIHSGEAKIACVVSSNSQASFYFK